MKPLAQKALAHIDSGDIKILSEQHEKVMRHWLDNIRDWCVSRQLWWGHQIPAWFVAKKGESISKTDMANNGRWVVARTEEVSENCLLCLQHSLWLLAIF
jgi:valyl-tRNA synthetase